MEHAALAATHGGQGPQGYRYPRPDHPGQGVGPLVHPSPPGKYVYTINEIIFDFPYFLSSSGPGLFQYIPIHTFHSYNTKILGGGWCPRTGLRAAVNDSIWLATCHSKIYEK